MSGIVQAILTDKELERLIAWGEFVDGADYPLMSDERRLLSKLEAWHRSVACKTCAPGGGSCPLPEPGRIDPADRMRPDPRK